MNIKELKRDILSLEVPASLNKESVIWVRDEVIKLLDSYKEK